MHHWTWLLALAPLAAQQPPASSNAAAARPGYAGDQMCQACHPDKWTPFHRNAHFKLTLTASSDKKTYACESCHGPGQAHIDGKGDKSKIDRIGGRGAAHILEACLACHSKDFPRANIRRSAHTTHDVACTHCHSIHGAQSPKHLLAYSRQRDLCYT